MSKYPTSYQLRLIEIPGVTEPAIYQASSTNYREACDEALALIGAADDPTVIEVLETRLRTWFGPVVRPRRPLPR